MGTGTSTQSFSVDEGEITLDALKNADTFTGWDLDKDGTKPNAVWRIYEGKTTPLLTAFMTRKDSITEQTYDGTADVGNSAVASTKTSTQADGINWVNDVTVINPKPLTLSGNVSKIYDGKTTATLSLSHVEGVVEADKTALSLSSTATAAYDTKNVGTGKTVTYSGLALTGDKAKNYSLAQAGSLNTGSITARDITATVADLDAKTYDGKTEVANVTATLANTIEGDAISATASGSYADKNVGTDKAVSYNSFTLSGADKGNYNLTTTSYTGKGSINAAPVTFKADDYSKEYDGTTAAPGATYQKTAGEIYGTDSYSGGTLTFDTPDPGEGKTLNLSNVTISDGNSGKNYAVTYQPSKNSKITSVTPEPTPTPEPMPKPEPTPADKPKSIEKKLEESGVTTQQLEAATNATTPNVQSNAASATPVTNPQMENQQPTATPEAPANAGLPMALSGNGMLTMENKGVNAPVSMNAENLVAPSHSNASSEAPATSPQGTLQNDNSAAGEQETAQGDNGENAQEDNERQNNEENE